MIRNTCLNYIRHLKVIENLKSKVKDHYLGEELYYIDMVGNKPYILIEKELEGMIMSIMNSLPEKWLAVFPLNRIDGLKNREISEQLDLSIKTVEKHILRPEEMEHPLLQSSYNELKGKLHIANQFQVKIFDCLRRFRLTLSNIAAMLAMALMTGFLIGYFLVGRAVPKNEIVWLETIVLRGEKSRLVLPDGSKVWVNPESRLSYPNDFMDGERKLKLTGEAYFEVNKQKGKPFTVETSDYLVWVGGTKFTVIAYPDFNRTETSVVEGKIEIRRDKQTIIVMPGQILTYAENRFKLKEGNTKPTIQWKDNVFDFDKITFKELLITLERWNDVEIKNNNPELNCVVYSGIFNYEETIWQVLQSLELSNPFYKG
jgi:ferric-dicitrate binding protein FerR (iron transport regulator)